MSRACVVGKSTPFCSATLELKMPAVPCARVQSGHDMCSVGARTHASHARHVEITRKGDPPCGIPARSATLVCSTRATNSHTHANPPPLTQLKSQHAPRPAFTSTPCSWHELHGCRTPSCEKISVLRSHDDAEEQRKIHPQNVSPLAGKFWPMVVWTGKGDP